MNLLQNNKSYVICGQYGMQIIKVSQNQSTFSLSGEQVIFQNQNISNFIEFDFGHFVVAKHQEDILYYVNFDFLSEQNDEIRSILKSTNSKNSCHDFLQVQNLILYRDDQGISIIDIRHKNNICIHKIISSPMLSFNQNLHSYGTMIQNTENEYLVLTHQ